MSLKTKINNFFRNYSHWLLIIILLYLLFTSRNPVIEVSSDNKELLRAVDYLKDRNEKIYAKLETEILEKSEALKRADSLAKVLKIKPKHIRGKDVLVQTTDTVFRDLPADIIYREKDTAYQITKKDEYVDIQATVGPRGGEIKYSSIDTLTLVHTVKTPLIGRTKRNLLINNSNPYNKVTKGNSWVVKEKEAWLTIGPSIQYNPFNNQLTVGISVQVPIIKFKK